MDDIFFSFALRVFSETSVSLSEFSCRSVVYSLTELSTLHLNWLAGGWRSLETPFSNDRTLGCLCPPFFYKKFTNLKNLSHTSHSGWPAEDLRMPEGFLNLRKWQTFATCRYVILNHQMCNVNETKTQTISKPIIIRLTLITEQQSQFCHQICITTIHKTCYCNTLSLRCPWLRNAILTSFHLTSDTQRC